MRLSECSFRFKLLAAVALLVIGGSSARVSAAVITGDPTTTTGAGLQLVGNSTDPQFQADVSGSGYGYDVYVGRYTVSAGDSTSGANLIGNTAEGVTGGSFNVGDDIFVIGWKSTTENAGNLVAATGDNFLKLNPTGNAGYLPASAPGGPVTSFSNSVPGDAQLHFSRNDANEFRTVGFRFNDGTGTSLYPYQVGGVGSAFSPLLIDLPFRAFGVNGSTDPTPNVLSQLYLLNVTDLNAASFGGQPFNPIGAGLPFYMTISSQGNSTGVVIPATAAVPEPASVALLLVGAGVLSMRRRWKATQVKKLCHAGC